MQRGSFAYPGSHSRGREGLGSDTHSTAPDRTLLTTPRAPPTSHDGHRKPSATPAPPPSPLLTPAILNLVNFHGGQAPLLLGAGSGLSGSSQTDGLPQPGLASKFLHAGPKHNTIEQPWLLFTKKAQGGVERNLIRIPRSPSSSYY